MLVKAAAPSPPARAAAPVQVEEGLITPETAYEIARAAARIKDIEDAPAPSTWRRMAERYIENGSLDPDDIKKLADFARKVRAQHRQLHSEFRQSNYQDRSLSKRLENIHLFLEAFERPHRQYLEANARAAVAAVAGA
ncbi:MAG TPA: hypothetical protein VNO81_10825, partial [Candidatus Nitrosotenuis sp.]|nr:hypothetical protein [Candidatus Nitrosotenuis sp.]